MSIPELLEHDHDIYRGEPSQPQQPPNTAPSIISTSTSSSASSLLAASRLGAIAAKLELAISRWAKNVRGNSFSASESSSSHSTSSSIVTLTKPQHTRWRRRSSVSSLRTLQSEREISARISRMKALEESRRIPRHFTLYLPLSISLRSPQNHSGAAMDIEDRQTTNQSLTSSTSLTLVLNQLDLAIKKTERNRRTRQRHRNPPRNTSNLDFSSFPSQLVHDNQFGSGPDPRAPRGRKGKHRESSTAAESTPIMEEPISKSQAWFLDVANPTWADLRAIGKVRFAVTLMYGTYLDTCIAFAYTSFNIRRYPPARSPREAGTLYQPWILFYIL
jgi:magnesium transporter